MSVPHTIRALAARTGLSPHTIRAWERRYSALEPHRTGTNRRIYDEQDVERLFLLKSAVEKGHSIGQIARLPSEDLRQMLAQPVAPPVGRPSPAAEEDFLVASLAAIDRLDASAFGETLVRGGAVMGARQLLDGVIIPVLDAIGQRWEHGAIRISQEHLATAVLRSFLDRLRETLEPATNASKLVVSTPSGQIHELGALIVAVEAAVEGWHVVYTGPNLPAEEIAMVVRQCGAKAICLSLVYPEADAELDVELRELRNRAGMDVAILVGGRAAPTYRESLDAIGAYTIPNLEGFREVLKNLGPA